MTAIIVNRHCVYNSINRSGQCGVLENYLEQCGHISLEPKSSEDKGFVRMCELAVHKRQEFVKCRHIPLHLISIYLFLFRVISFSFLNSLSFSC
jgi:hypothetical protein